MVSANRRGAVVCLNTPPDGETPPAHRTFVCLGIPRGGTSAVAGTMQRLGVFMGEDLPNNYEDPEFNTKLNGGALQPMSAAIARRRAAHAVWGWKYPGAEAYLDALRPELENPHLVVVFRDLVAVMNAHMRYYKRDHLAATQEVMALQARNWDLIQRWQVPTALVSYEKAVVYPKRFVLQMAEFLGMPEPERETRNALAEFLRPGRYK